VEAILSDKGQITIPKDLRDRLGLQPGSKIELTMVAQGTIQLKAKPRGSAGLAGLLRKAGQRPIPIEEMNQAVGEHLAADDARIKREWNASNSRKRNK
jgi:AbrB family looped-hinge helix DNA binding protein